MQQIRLTCEHCRTVHDLRKTPELPAHVFVMRCNWCPHCEGQVDDYYSEWWDDDEDGNKGNPVPQPVPDNQLCMPFIMDEIGITPEHTQPVV